MDLLLVSDLKAKFMTAQVLSFCTYTALFFDLSKRVFENVYFFILKINHLLDWKKNYQKGIPF